MRGLGGCVKEFGLHPEWVGFKESDILRKSSLAAEYSIHSLEGDVQNQMQEIT